MAPQPAKTARPIEQLRFDQRFVRELPADASDAPGDRPVLGACYSRVSPTAVASPELLIVVPEVAALLELDPSVTPTLNQVLAGNQVLTGMAPYAACYGGHQFGNWAGQLGDGRAITLAEIEDQRGQRWELQLKGAGKTPYSRRGDGRAVLRSSLRELVCSEAMHHLGVPTTRALSLSLTGEPVMRDMLYDGHPEDEPGAVVARVAPTFLRFGSYEIHTARRDFETLRKLTDFTLRHYFPELVSPQGALDVPGFIAEVARRTARLMVEWQRVGFVHGVMNTDNMSIVGLTLDYGPYGFLDGYEPEFTPNTTDAAGRRYRYENQPNIGYWNVVQLARALSPLVDEAAPLQQAVQTYADELAVAQRRMLLGKLGLSAAGAATDADDALVSRLLSLLTMAETDMTLFFRGLAKAPASGPREAALAQLEPAYYAPVTAGQRAQLGTFLDHYFARARVEAGLDDAVRRARMDAVNPLYLPRNYLVHACIEKTAAGDRRVLPELLEVLRNPYQEQANREAYAEKRPEWARHRAGCSMLSCSS